MIKNPLFHFIGSEEYDLGTVKPSRKPGKPYFLFGLSVPPQINFRTEEYFFRLEDHHITVHEHEHRSKTELSQYHYTASLTLINEAEGYQQLCTLHVYFDDHDTVLGLSLRDNEKNNQAISSELRYALTDLAFSSCMPIISEWRQRLNLQVERLEASCQAVEEEANRLSECLVTGADRKQYMAKLDAFCETLQKLAYLVKHTHYQQVLRFIRFMQQRIITQPAVLVEGTVEPDELVEGERATSRAAVRCFTPQTPSSLEKEIDALFLHFTGVKQEAIHHATINAFDDILRKTYGFFLRMEDEKIAISDTALDHLSVLHKQTRFILKKAFPKVLLSANGEMVRQLSSCHHLITLKHLILALQSRKPHLLDILLTYGKTELLNSPVTVRGTNYPSAVRYCFDFAAEENIPECFAVLIKHNASLFIETGEGMPVACAILLQDRHPLKAALSSVKDKNLYDTGFYRHLIAALHRYLLQKTLPEEQREVILRAITLYREEIVNLSRTGLVQQVAIHKLHEDFLTKHNQKYFLEQIRKEPDVIKHIETQQTLVSFVTKKFDKKAWRMCRLMQQNMLQDYSDFLAHVDLGMSYSQVRESVIAQLERQTNVMQWQKEWIEMSDRLQSCKKGEEKKQLATRVTELECNIHAAYVQIKGEMPIKNTEKSLAALTKMEDAVRQGNLENFRHCFAVTAKILRSSSAANPQPYLNNLLTIAILAKNEEMVRALLDTKLYTPRVLNAKSGICQPAIFVAASAGDAALIRVLYAQHGAELNCTNAQGATALFIAAQLGHEEAVVQLTELGAEVDIRCLEIGATALHIAAENGHAGVIRQLVSHNANRNALRKDNTTPLFLASESGHEEAVLQLLELGAEVDIPCLGVGATALDAAEDRGHAGVIRLLVSHGANPNALEIATARQLTEIAILLKEALRITHGNQLKSLGLFAPAVEERQPAEEQPAAARHGRPKAEARSPR